MKRLLMLALLAAASAYAQGPNYPYSVTLVFTASTSPNVTGYNMYRAPYASGICGAFVKINSTPFTGTTYTDATPTEGTYCYEATAVSPNGESGASNIDKNLVIPPPPPTGLGATVAGLTVTWQWQQAVAKPTKNSLYCAASATGPFTRRWNGKPVTSTSLKMTKGPHYCRATVTDKSGESGASLYALAVVQ